MINGRTFVSARYVAEAFGATVRWKDEIKTVYIDTNKTGKVEDEDDKREVAGFIVPKDTNLVVAAIKDNLNDEAVLIIDFLKQDVEKQKDDLEKILLQKFSVKTVEEIMSIVRKKVKDTDIIEPQYFYDNKTGQYIYLDKSVSKRGSTITLYILKKGVKPVS